MACPYPTCINCIAELSGPARLAQLKKVIPLLPHPQDSGEEHILEMWIANVKKTLEVYGRPTSFILEAISCGFLDCLVDLIGHEQNFLSPYALIILDSLTSFELQANRVTYAQKFTSNPRLLPKLLDVFTGGLVTEKQHASNLIMKLCVANVPFYRKNYSALIDLTIGIGNFVTYTVAEFNAEMSEDSDDSRCPTYQVDIIKPMKSLEYLREYGPRFVPLVNEAGMRALSTCAGVIIGDLRKSPAVYSRADVQRLAGAMFAVWDKSCVDPVPNLAYPESMLHSELLVTALPLAMMPVGYNAEQCPREVAVSYLAAEFLEALAIPPRLGSLKKMLTFFDTTNMPLPDSKTIMKVMKRHHSELPFGEEELDEFQGMRRSGLSRAVLHLAQLCMCPSTAGLVAADNDLVARLHRLVELGMNSGIAGVTLFDPAARTAVGKYKSAQHRDICLMVVTDGWKAWGPEDNASSYVAYHPSAFDGALVALLHLRHHVGASIELSPAVLQMALKRAEIACKSGDTFLRATDSQNAAMRYELALQLTLLQRQGAVRDTSASYAKKMNAALRRCNWDGVPLQREGPSPGYVWAGGAQVDAASAGPGAGVGAGTGVVGADCCVLCRAKPSAAKPLQCCSRCLSTRYCSRECQKAHWPTHKPVCSPPSSA